MSIHSILTQTNQVSIERTPQTERRSLYSNIARKIHRFALPAIGLYALASIPIASAGPVSYGLCVTACYTASIWQPWLIPLCIEGCAPILALPTP